MSWIEDPGTNDFEGLDLTQLGIDEAYVRVATNLDHLWLYTLSEECYKCPYSLREDLSTNRLLKYKTKHAESWRFYEENVSETLPATNDSGSLCNLWAKLGEFGVYDLRVNRTGSDDNATTTCDLTTAKPPVNIYLPLLICFLGFLAILLVWIASCQIRVVLKKRAKKRYIVPTSQLNNLDVPSPEPEIADSPTPTTSGSRRRVRSLDAFRGIAIVLMIFVNFGSGHYWFFDHSTWNGLQLADLLFPWFMWIMGVCIPMSLKSQLQKNVPRFEIFKAILRRSVILFALGLMLSTVGVGGRLETIRIFGVLQRFGVAYFTVATLGLLFTCRAYSTPKWRLYAALQDVVVLLPQWVCIGGVIAGHTVLIFMFEVPGCPTGYLGPGGIQDDSQYQECVGGATGYLDELILGTNHIYQYPTTNEVYRSGPFDPEGIIGCLTTVVQVFLGVQAGAVLLYHEGVKERVWRWLGWGVVTGVAGAVLCLASREDGWIPVNKNLWSMSYVLVTSCFAFFLLTLCYLLIDVKKWWSGAPFFYAGMNSMILYVGHSLTYNVFPWHWAYGPMNTHFMLLMECLWGTALWVVVAYWLYKVKFFLAI